MRGTFVGIIFLGVINNGMTLFGVGDFEQYVVRGLLILIAVMLNTIQLGKREHVSAGPDGADTLRDDSTLNTDAISSS